MSKEGHQNVGSGDDRKCVLIFLNFSVVFGVTFEKRLRDCIFWQVQKEELFLAPFCQMQNLCLWR